MNFSENQIKDSIKCYDNEIIDIDNKLVEFNNVINTKMDNTDKLSNDIDNINKIKEVIISKYQPLNDLKNKIAEEYCVFLPSKYAVNEYALNYFIQYIYYGQANTIGECINLFEHRELQEEIIGQMISLNKAVNSLKGAVVNELSKINMKLDTVSLELAVIGKNISSINSNVSNISHNVSNINDNVSNISRNVSNINHNIGTVINGQVVLLDSIDKMGEEVGKNNNLVSISNDIASSSNALIAEGNQIEANNSEKLTEQYNKTQKLYLTTLNFNKECTDFISSIKHEKHLEGKMYY